MWQLFLAGIIAIPFIYAFTQRNKHERTTDEIFFIQLLGARFIKYNDTHSEIIPYKYDGILSGLLIICIVVMFQVPFVIQQGSGSLLGILGSLIAIATQLPRFFLKPHIVLRDGVMTISRPLKKEVTIHANEVYSIRTSWAGLYFTTITIFYHQRHISLGYTSKIMWTSNRDKIQAQKVAEHLEACMQAGKNAS